MSIYFVPSIMPGSRDIMNKTDLKVLIVKQDYDVYRKL